MYERRTISSLDIGGVPQLGPGYAAGFSLGGLVRGIGGFLGSVAGGALGLPGRAAGPNALTLPVPIRGGGAGGMRGPTTANQRLLQQLAGGMPDFSDVQSGASTTAFRGFRRRRMNPLNLRALGRADRRLEAFAKIARRYVSPNAPQRVVRTKRRKAR